MQGMVGVMNHQPSLTGKTQHSNLLWKQKTLDVHIHNTFIEGGSLCVNAHTLRFCTTEFVWYTKTMREGVQMGRERCNAADCHVTMHPSLPLLCMAMSALLWWERSIFVWLHYISDSAWRFCTHATTHLSSEKKLRKNTRDEKGKMELSERAFLRKEWTQETSSAGPSRPLSLSLNLFLSFSFFFLSLSHTLFLYLSLFTIF
jgi:hypothetical protein